MAFFVKERSGSKCNIDDYNNDLLSLTSSND